MLLNFSVRIAVANAVQQINWGVTVVDIDAFNAAAVPDTNDPNEQPGWMFRGGGAISANNIFDRSQWIHVDKTIKSQRKFDGNSSLLVFFVDNTGTNDCTLNGVIRMLVKKP